MTLINSQVSMILDIHWSNRSPELKGFLISKGATNTVDFFNSTSSGATKLTALKQADDQDCYIFAYKHQTTKGWLGLLQCYIHGIGLGDGLYMCPESMNWAFALGSMDLFATLYGATFSFGINSWGDNPIASVDILPASIALSGLAPNTTDQNGFSLQPFLANGAPYGINGDGTNGTTTNTQMLVTPSGNDLKGNAFSSYASTYKVTNAKWTTAAGGANYSTGVNDNPVGHIDWYLQAALQLAFAATGSPANISLLKFINKKANTGSNLTNTAAFNLLKAMVLAYDPDLLVWIYINLGIGDSAFITNLTFSSLANESIVTNNTNPWASTGTFINIDATVPCEDGSVNANIVINNVIGAANILGWSNSLSTSFSLSSLPKIPVPFYSYLYPQMKRYQAYDYSSTTRFNTIKATYPNYKLPPTWSSTANFGGLFPTSVTTFGQTQVQPSNPSGSTTVYYGTLSTTVFGNPSQLHINGATPTTTPSLNTWSSIVSKPPGDPYSDSYLNPANYGGDFNIFS